MNCYFTLPPQKMREMGFYDPDTFKLAKDGSFEIIASATPHDGNWIKLDPEQNRNFILVRDYFLNWDNEELTELHIEPVDQKVTRPIHYSESEMIHRLEDAARFMQFATRFYGPKTAEDALRDADGAYNAFARQKPSSAPSQAADNAAVAFNIMVYDIGPDEAIIIEVSPPSCRYWGINLSDIWSGGLDYVYHQSSLTSHHAVADSDGKARFVLCHRDPGIRNWLDPIGNRRGMVILRWLPVSGNVPVAYKVVSTEVRRILPEDTALVSKAERDALLRVRAFSALRRYGY